MAAPNLASALQIYGKTVLHTPTTSLAAVLSNNANSNKLFKINVIRAANTVTSVQNLSVTIYRSSTHEYLIKNAIVVPNASLVVTDKNEYIYLEEGDSIYAQASANTSIDLTLHYEEIYNA